MPKVDNIARCVPLGQGKAKFTLLQFNSQEELGINIQNMEVLVVRRNEDRLADWHSINLDGFKVVSVSNARQRTVNFEFDVAQDVVNPMAFDNSGDYILKIKNTQGIIRSFTVSMQGMLMADSTYREEVAPKPAFNAQMNMDANNANNAFNNTLNPNLGATSTQTSNKSSNASLGKIIAIVAILALLLGGGFFALKMLGILGGSSFNDVAQEQVKEDSKSDSKDESQQDTATDVDEALAQQEEKARETLDAVDPKQEAIAKQQYLISSIDACKISQQQGSDIEIINRCLATNPSNEELFAVVSEALHNERCEIALRVLRTKGRGNDGDSAIFAYIYGQLADPKGSYTSKCITKSNSDRDYWLNKAKQSKFFDESKAQEKLDSVVKDINAKQDNAQAK